MNNKFLVGISLLLATVFFACSNDSTSTNNNNGGGGNNNTTEGSMKLTVDGTAYDWTTATATKQTAGGMTIYTVAAIDAAGTSAAGFSISNISGPGTYTVGASSTRIVTLEYHNGTDSFQAGLPGTSGTITVTQLSPNVIATFSGTLSKTSGSGTVTITNGSVNAKVM